MADALTPRIWGAAGHEPHPFKIGTYRGRLWHFEAKELGRDSLKMLFPQTLCGRRGFEDWRPGYRNWDPKTCGECLRLLEAAAETHYLEADRG